MPWRDPAISNANCIPSQDSGVEETISLGSLDQWQARLITCITPWPNLTGQAGVDRAAVVGERLLCGEIGWLRTPTGA